MKLGHYNRPSMPHPIAIRSPLAPAYMLRRSVRLLIAAAMLPAWHVSANCPEPVQPKESDAPTLASIDPTAPIAVESDSVEATGDGRMLLKGEVTISQQARTIKTQDATYDRDSNRFSVEGGVDYADPTLRIRGTGAQVDPAGSVTFRGAEFELPTIPARGSADRISATLEGDIELDRVRYTTCPIGNEDWLLSASAIDISQQRGLGTGRNVRLDFKGVPILYVPYFSFPVGNERKSGFLYPNFGSHSRDGLSVPWYWNIRPNFDATLVPTYDIRRGVKLDTEWRYLLRNGHGVLETQWLPHDEDRDTDRSYIRFINQTDFTRALRLDLDAAEVSDEQWFEDFGQGPEGTSVLYLSRAAQLSYRTNHWTWFARAQNFQTVDERIPEASRPFTVLPQIGVRGLIPNLAYGLTFALDGELAHFTHTVDDPSTLATGARLDVAPQIRMPLRGAGMYLEPALAWRYTAYLLEDMPAGTDDSPSRSAPIFSLDGSLSFERLTGSRGQRLQTLEPRLMYLYVPYRNQDNLPVFDTTVADLNLVQLFRTNRYTGWDRLSDANQLSVGITSRLLDAENGKQFISATIGQAFYFREPRVTLPGEPLDDTESSDIIAELQLTAYQNWNIRMGVQWDPDDTRSERGEVQIQYRPNYDRVVNVGYRFRRGIGTSDLDPADPSASGPFSVTRRSLEQIDGSAAWPIGERWSAYARMVYSLEDRQALDQFAGIEYRSCCWRLRLVGRRYVRSREGDMDTSILLQLELNGLSSVGTGADTFLERSIRGYSSRAPELR
jgi:LPS-assembly protein